MNQRIKDIVNKHFSFDDEDLQAAPKKKLNVGGIAQAHKDQIWINENFVDLGLPSGTLWCKHNIGATKPEDFGNYYAWGETETKTLFGTGTYKFFDGGLYLTKYCTLIAAGKLDGKIKIEPCDDAAYQENSLMCIPTMEQFQELRDNTNHNSIVVDGHTVYVFVSKKDSSKFILIPGAGCKGGTNDCPDNYGYYWTSNLSPSNAKHAHAMCMLPQLQIYGTSKPREYGLAIRPVLKQ